eukprot:11732054-Ditylum_brightwellii.AAC.1
MAEPRTPSIQWAQRRDCILLTVDLLNCSRPSVKLDDAASHGRLLFKVAEAGPDKVRAHVHAPAVKTGFSGAE